ncbi:MAG: hypothetical protein AAF927_04380 [Bacteroidota bacterium]
MSTNRHPLDDLFRNGAGQRDFPFQESYWLQAEQMILAEQKRRKQYLLSLITYSLILVTVISIPLLVWIFSGNRLFAELRPIEPFSATHTLLESPQALTQGIPLAVASVSPSGERSFSSQVAYEQSRAANQSAQSIRQAHQGQGNDETLSTLASLEPQGRPDFSFASTEDDRPSLSSQLKQLKRLGFNNTIWSLSSQFAKEISVPPSGFPRNELSLWLGFNLNPSAVRFNDWSTHPAMGLKYAFGLTRRLKLYTGLTYQGRGGINAVTNIQQIYYNFGADIDANVLNVERLHYLEMPIGLDMRVYKGHYLLLGAQMSYLVNASGTITNRAENSFGIQKEETSAAWGYTQGLRTWNPALTAGYAYYWKRGIRLGATANYNLKSPFGDEYFLERELSPLQFRVFAEFYLSHF